MEFTTKAKILVLFANAYEINDNGRTMAGCTVHYLFWGEHGEQLLSQSETNLDKAVGFQRAKCSLDFDMRAKLQVAPAIYNGDFVMQTGSDGKPVLKLVDVAYVSNVEMKEKVIPGVWVPGMIQPEEKK